MRLYIDDIRTPKSKFDLITRSSKETIEFLKNNVCPNYISFDHDLGGDDTSIPIIKFLVNLDMDMDGQYIPYDFDFNVHSANPVGAANIESYINSYLKQRQKSTLEKVGENL